MKVVKMGSTGTDVKRLQEYLGLSVDGNFGPNTLEEVKKFQATHNLDPDGIVGKSSWISIYNEHRVPSKSISWEDYDFMSYLLGCEIAALKAIQKVETGGKSGFFDNGEPMILFEGHIFWKQLKAHGLDPLKFVKGNENILYQKWDKSKYIGGQREYERLAKASKIHKVAALESASWGMFQIMGNNYAQSDCNNVEEFVNLMQSGQYNQLLLSVRFIYNSPKLRNALAAKDWSTFAKLYNGSGYKLNAYDTKLMSAYKSYKG